MLIIASYGEDSAPNAMNAAWGGVADSSRIAMYLSGGHKTVKNILKRGAFTVSMGDAEHAAPVTMWASSPATACPTRWRARASA